MSACSVDTQHGHRYHTAPPLSIHYTEGKDELTTSLLPLLYNIRFEQHITTTLHHRLLVYTYSHTFTTHFPTSPNSSLPSVLPRSYLSFLFHFLSLSLSHNRHVYRRTCQDCRYLLLHMGTQSATHQSPLSFSATLPSSIPSHPTIHPSCMSKPSPPLTHLTSPLLSSPLSLCTLSLPVQFTRWPRPQ